MSIRASNLAADRDTLRTRAREVVVAHGFTAEWTADVRAELSALAAGESAMDGARDLRSLLWSSIDNPESRDLDQVEVCETLPGGRVRLRLGIADVDHLVPKDSAIDVHAAANTTSVYTGVAVFPMLPEALSNDRTSLVEGTERLAVVVDLTVDASGDVSDVSAYRAIVVNHAKLAYAPVGEWLERSGPVPAGVSMVDGLEAQVRLQDEVAERLRRRRHERGALDLETIEARTVVRDGRVVDLEVTRKNRARELIEDFMIAANVAMAGFLEERGVASIRRVVRAPRRWRRIVQVAAGFGATLPDAPSAAALAGFLRQRRDADPEGFADLSLSVVKLLGSGEYTVERPWEPDGDEGHFGLAVDDYSHTTAPNRRYADLVMQRLLKTTIAGEPAPYAADALDAIAARCTEREDAARKVERVMRKVAAAALLADRIGETFDAIVTGVNERGTFARVIRPPAEGRVVRGEAGLDVGDRVRVRLVEVDAGQGFIDFERVR